VHRVTVFKTKLNQLFGALMKLTLLVIAAITLSFQAFAQSPSMSEKRFCSDRLDKNFVKKLAMDSDNLMSFNNHGGLVNGGVCWWHSRFQRNALYLTIYKPDLPLPSASEAYELVKKIRAGSEVVVIPGYRNFLEFTSDNEEIIQHELEKWQRGDSFIGFAWVRGLSGSSEVAPEKLKALMDQIYQEVEVNKNISYNKLQIKGVTAHAWLVVEMKKFSGGYNLKVIDSNRANTVDTYTYREGDTNIIENHFNFSFTPYLERSNELVKIYSAITNLCVPRQ
jgi:hypothetical protein